MARPDWDNYYLQIARAASWRGTCTRLQVGAVVVDKDKRVVSLGYNGAPSGQPQCDEVGCLLVNGHCGRSLHAEPNALAAAERSRTTGATIYIYGTSPCYPDALLILAFKISRVVWCSAAGGIYEGTVYDPKALEFLETAGVSVEQLPAL